MVHVFGEKNDFQYLTLNWPCLFLNALLICTILKFTVEIRASLILKIKIRIGVLQMILEARSVCLENGLRVQTRLS